MMIISRNRNNDGLFKINGKIIESTISMCFTTILFTVTIYNDIRRKKSHIIKNIIQNKISNPVALLDVDGLFTIRFQTENKTEKHRTLYTLMTPYLEGKSINFE